MTDNEGQAGPVILPAKLRVPVPRPDTVSRLDLVEALESAGPECLRAIVAPTGWGKSELVAQWLAAHRHPVAYVRLDANDTDPTRCWAHILAALQNATGVVVDDLREALRAPGLPVVAEVVEPLLARFEGHDVTLVLEDLSLAASAEIHESIEALIDGRPAGMGVAVVSRIEPPLHLPRRRVRGELVEIRLDDLQMDAPAAARIVEGASGLQLDAESIGALVTRTEGWAAGLYLAGLSLLSTDDPAAAIDRFSGTDRNLSEYLASEVLAGLRDDDREFLVGTAVLQELEPEICDAVLDRADSAARIDALRQANMFLIPVDENRGIYRYHQLFQQWLEVELRRRGPSAVGEAHRRATHAYAARGDHLRAAEHSLDAADDDLAYDCVARCSLTLLDTGRHTTLNQWCHRLPPPPDADRALALALLRGWSSIVDGDLDSVDRWCSRATEAIETGTVSDPALGRSGEISLLQAYSHLLRGLPSRCQEILAAARATGTSDRADATAQFLDAAATYWLDSAQDGKLPDGFKRARATAIAVGDPYAKLLCEAYLALQALDADRPGAHDWIDETFATADHHHLVGFGYLAAGTWARGRRAVATGELELARADVERAVELAERRGDTLVACGARITLSEIHHSLGDASTARELLDTVDRDLAPLDSGGVLEGRVGVARRQLRLQQTTSPTRSYAAPVEHLTDREVALLRLLPGELTQRELGDALHMSFNTVKTYNRQIYRKLGVSSRDDAVAAAREAGLL